MNARPLTCALLVGVLLGACRQPPVDPKEFEWPASIDFPTHDAWAWDQVARELVAAELESGGDPSDPDRIIGWLSLMDRSLVGMGNRENHYARNAFEGLERLIAGSARDLEQAATILLYNTHNIWRHDHVEARDRLVCAARARADALPRDRRASTERLLIVLENRDQRERKERLIAFAAEYAGTDAGVEAELDLIDWYGQPDQSDAALDEIIEQAVNPCTRARALLVKARRRSVCCAQNIDPTPRFLELLDLVDRVKAAASSDCYSARWAPRVITAFGVNRDTPIAPEKLPVVVAGYLRAIVDHLKIDERHPVSTGMGYVLTYQIPELYGDLRDHADAVDRVFAHVASWLDDTEALRYLHGMTYRRDGKRDWDDEPRDPTMTARGLRILADLAADGEGPYAGKALATIATEQLYERDFDAAEANLARYLERWPDSDWAWVAALRIGLIHEFRGDWAAAAASHTAAVERYPEPALARVLGNVFAARGYETLGNPERALLHYRRALAGWNDDVGWRYHLGTDLRRTDGASRKPREPDDGVVKVDLAERVAEMTEMLALPGGREWAWARRLIELGQWNAAEDVLSEVIAAAPAGLVARKARHLLTRARLERALNAEATTPGEVGEATIATLDSLAEQAWDPATGAAALARAAVMLKRGDAEAAREATVAALKTWHARQRAHLGPDRGADVADDVRAIRDLLFQPLDSSIDGGELLRWNAWERPAQREYLTVDPDLLVTLADGAQSRVRVTGDIPGLPKVVFMTAQDQATLRLIQDRIGGTEHGAITVLNPPTGDTRAILELWWRCGVLLAYPRITQVDFIDEARTQASVKLSTGSRGATAVVTKTDGRWSVARLTNGWVT